MENKVVAISITYHDALGRKSFAYKQDLTRWSAMRRLGDPPHIEIAAHLKKISETLGRWTSHSRLGVDVYDDSDREKANAEMSKIFRDMEGES